MIKFNWRSNSFILEKTSEECDCGTKFYKYLEGNWTKYVCPDCNRGYRHGEKPNKLFTNLSFFKLVVENYRKQLLIDEIKRL